MVSRKWSLCATGLSRYENMLKYIISEDDAQSADDRAADAFARTYPALHRLIGNT